MKPENLTCILNKLYAMKVAKVVRISQIAKAIGEGPTQTSMWVMQRCRRPRADAAFKLLAFAADQTIKIAASPRKTQQAYRAAYRAACDKFPTTGER